FIKELVNKSCVHRYDRILKEWEVSLIWSFTVSIFCIGGLLGSLMAGSLSSRFGRKHCLLLNNFLAIFGAILMLLSRTANSFEMIMVGRFFYGLNAGVGLSAQAMYLTESAPKQLRATVGVTIATSLSFGKFLGQLLGIRELLGTEKNWHWLLGFNGFTALFQLCTLPLLPESPRYLLLERGNVQASENAFRKLWGKNDYNKEVVEMLEEKAALQSVRSCSVLELIQNRTVRWQLLTIVIAFTALQLCGLNAFMIIESIGRKVLLFRGYMGMAASLGLLSVTVYFQKTVWWMPYCSMVLVFLFISFFSSGPAATTVSLPGEILTQSFKSAGYTLGCTVNWTCLFVLGTVFPILVGNLGNFCFLIFLAVCLICGLHVKFNMPETKDRTALEISVEFERMHAKDKASEKKKASEIKVQETKL
ncbi:hypothetical protein AMECASPLE_006510, partial [Ameca splendens]